MGVPIRTTPALDVGTPRALFSVARPWFDVTSDAGKFIAIVPQVLEGQPLPVVLNWHEEVRKYVGRSARDLGFRSTLDKYREVRWRRTAK